MRHSPSLLILASLALAGCGGGGPRSTGTYGVAGSVERGEVTLMVSKELLINGTVRDPNGVPGTILPGSLFQEDFPAKAVGTIIAFVFDDPGTQDLNSKADHDGSASLDARGHLIITHKDPTTAGNVVSYDDFDLVRIEH